MTLAPWPPVLMGLYVYYSLCLEYLTAIIHRAPVSL